MFAWYNKSKGKPKSKTVAFLHPFCAGGGGGEVVLWDAIAYMMQQRGEKLKFDKIVIYSANDDQNKKLSKVLKKVEKRFDIKISEENLKYLSLIPLSSYWIIKPDVFPFASLLLQSLAAICLAFEGLFKFTPHIFIDTTGLIIN